MIPVTVVTGYLGSGKTTLIGRLLADPALADTAVIVNEFGEIGLDHSLISASRDNILRLMNGCVCCTIREDLALEMRNLHRLRALGDVPRFERLLIETTGLADPVPIIHTLMANTSLRKVYAMQGVVTLVDALAGERTLDQQPVAARQVAHADRLLLTKTDIAPADMVARLEARLRAINPSIDVIAIEHGDIAPALVFAENRYPRPANAAGSQTVNYAAIEKWLAVNKISPHGHPHQDGIQTFAVVREAPLGLAELVLFFQELVNYRPEQLLRVKGLVAIRGREETPAVVHCICDKVYPITWLPRWPSADRSTRLVFITDRLERSDIIGIFNDVCASES